MLVAKISSALERWSEGCSECTCSSERAAGVRGTFVFPSLAFFFLFLSNAWLPSVGRHAAQGTNISVMHQTNSLGVLQSCSQESQTFFPLVCLVAPLEGNSLSGRTFCSSCLPFI